MSLVNYACVQLHCHAQLLTMYNNMIFYGSIIMNFETSANIAMIKHNSAYFKQLSSEGVVQFAKSSGLIWEF